MKLRKRGWVGVAASVAGLLLTLGTTTPALAGTTTPATPLGGVTVYAPMHVGGYNAAVAEAHGYKIVTSADGSQSSVPVTPQAIAQQTAITRARANALASPNGEVEGDCGDSFINAVKKANNTVAYSTGYFVFGAVVDSTWQVIATGFVSGNSVRLHPGARLSGSWSTEGTLVHVIGPGIANVAPFASYAVLAGGQVCYSGGPSAAFG